MHVVIVSDTHLGWEEANDSDFRDFLNNEIPSIKPDKLVLAGDIAELWRKSMTTALLEYSDVFKSLIELHEDGVDIIPVGGNHDWRLMKSNAEGKAIANPPWQFEEEHRFESGGKDFVVVHGHQGDAANRNDKQNESLCLTDDETSNAIASGWESITSRLPFSGRFMTTTPIISRPNLKALDSMSNPGTLSKPENRDRVDRITQRLRRKYDDFVIFGHTHVPEIGEDYANAGSWSGDKNTYIEVQNGEVSLRTY